MAATGCFAPHASKAATQDERAAAAAVWCGQALPTAQGAAETCTAHVALAATGVVTATIAVVAATAIIATR